MRKVYVVNKSAHDFSEAEKYGELVFLSEGPMSRYAISQMERLFTHAMADSSPEDYILCTSLTQMNIVATYVFASMHARLNLLIHKYFNNGRSGYVERSLIS